VPLPDVEQLRVGGRDRIGARLSGEPEDQVVLETQHIPGPAEQLGPGLGQHPHPRRRGLGRRRPAGHVFKLRAEHSPEFLGLPPRSIVTPQHRVHGRPATRVGQHRRQVRRQADRPYPQAAGGQLADGRGHLQPRQVRVELLTLARVRLADEMTQQGRRIEEPDAYAAAAHVHAEQAARRFRLP
jgi:hypothetical protein